MPKINGPKRSTNIIVRLYPDEKKQIQNLAKANLKSPSDYVREKSLSELTPKQTKNLIEAEVENQVQYIKRALELEYQIRFESEYQRRVGSLNWWKLWNDWREYSKKTISQKLLK